MSARGMYRYRGAAKLPTTRWSIVMLAGHEAPEARKQALAELCVAYWTPVYDFIRATGRPAEEARALTQGFFTTRLLEKNDLVTADRKRGKFRNWLLAAVKSYLGNELEIARAKKHPPAAEIVSINAVAAEALGPIQSGTQVAPEHIYERRWAITVLEQALNELKETYVKRNREALFVHVKPFLVDPGTERFGAIAKELNMTEDAFADEVSRCRRLFQERMRAEIGETVSHEDEIEDELRYLQSSLQPR